MWFQCGGLVGCGEIFLKPLTGLRLCRIAFKPAEQCVFNAGLFTALHVVAQFMLEYHHVRRCHSIGVFLQRLDALRDHGHNLLKGVGQRLIDVKCDAGRRPIDPTAPAHLVGLDHLL